MRCRLIQVVVCALLAILPGCGDGISFEWGRKRELPPEQPPAPLPQRDPLLADTIGDETLLGNGEPMRLYGFGLVIGLGENGSSDCPSALREHLVQYLDKQFIERGRGRPTGSAARMIDSEDTAVVEVSGLVPPGARRGARFDVRVEAVAGTQTRSLEGGLLILCELRMIQGSSRGALAGRVLARAEGVVFTNPFREPGERATSGFVLGGGVTLEDRPFRFLLAEPSYPAARRIEARLNERFGHRPRTAEALSRGYVEVRTPPRFADEPERFMELAKHLYVREEPSYRDARLRDIAERLGDPTLDLERASLIWEGVGRTGVERVQPLYDHSDERVRFYAARAGLRLEDVTAVPVLGRLAAGRRGDFRLAAVRELGSSTYPQAANHLVPLLDDADLEVRVGAYEGLRRLRHGAVRSRVFYNDIDPLQLNFVFDQVRSAGEPLIYVRRSREPRIALFGEDVPLRKPLLYAHPEDRVLINAEADGPVTVSYRPRYAMRSEDPRVIPATVADLVAILADHPRTLDDAKRPGAGLTCAEVVEVLVALCRDGTIPAAIEIERASMLDVLGAPTAPRVRPEGDDELFEPRGESDPKEQR